MPGTLLGVGRAPPLALFMCSRDLLDRSLLILLMLQFNLCFSRLFPPLDCEQLEDGNMP